MVKINIPIPFTDPRIDIKGHRPGQSPPADGTWQKSVGPLKMKRRQAREQGTILQPRVALRGNAGAIAEGSHPGRTASPHVHVQSSDTLVTNVAGTARQSSHDNADTGALEPHPGVLLVRPESPAPTVPSAQFLSIPRNKASISPSGLLPRGARPEETGRVGLTHEALRASSYAQSRLHPNSAAMALGEGTSAEGAANMTGSQPSWRSEASSSRKVTRGDDSSLAARRRGEGANSSTRRSLNQHQEQAEIPSRNASSTTGARPARRGTPSGMTITQDGSSRAQSLRRVLSDAKMPTDTQAQSLAPANVSGGAQPRRLAEDTPVAFPSRYVGAFSIAMGRNGAQPQGIRLSEAQFADVGHFRRMSRSEATGQVYFGQVAVSHRFSTLGMFRGASVQDVAQLIRSGQISPSEIPIHTVRWGGQRVAINNRSLTALRMANVEPSNTLDVTDEIDAAPENPDNIVGFVQRMRELGFNPTARIGVRAPGANWSSPAEYEVTLAKDDLSNE